MGCSNHHSRTALLCRPPHRLLDALSEHPEEEPAAAPARVPVRPSQGKPRGARRRSVHAEVQITGGMIRAPSMIPRRRRKGSVAMEEVDVRRT